MAKVARKVSEVKNIKSSSSFSSVKSRVESTRQPSLIREMGDVDFGTLDSTKDGYVVTYDNLTGDFSLMSPDDVLTKSTATPAPEDFIDQLEDQLDLGTIQVESLDGGEF